MIKKEAKKVSRQKRHLRIRSKISGTQERPRLCVFRSDKHIYAQLIDDVNGVTLAQSSTLDKSLGLERTSNIEAAKAVGTKIGELAKEKGIEEVVFDRAGYIYHGRIKELAEAARSAGLKF